MKSCTKCKHILTDDQFSAKNLTKNAAWCRPCIKAYDQARWSAGSRRETKIEQTKICRRRNRQHVWDYLTRNPCPCGETDPIVLEFDHRDGMETKRGNICEMASRGLSIETIDAEIAKCDVLCANCHRRKTAKQFGWHADLIT